MSTIIYFPKTLPSFNSPGTLPKQVYIYAFFGFQVGLGKSNKQRTTFTTQVFRRMITLTAGLVKNGRFMYLSGRGAGTAIQIRTHLFLFPSQSCDFFLPGCFVYPLIFSQVFVSLRRTEHRYRSSLLRVIFANLGAKVCHRPSARLCIKFIPIYEPILLLQPLA